MKIDEKTEKKIQELQLLEQNLQNFMLQKQAFQFELNETISALNELKKTKETVYKIVGQIMIQSSRSELEKELNEKKNIIELRIKNIAKQEFIFNEKVEKLRKEVVEKLK